MSLTQDPCVNEEKPCPGSPAGLAVTRNTSTEERVVPSPAWMLHGCLRPVSGKAVPAARSMR